MSQVLSLFLSVLMLLSCTAGCAPQTQEAQEPAVQNEAAQTVPEEAEDRPAEAAGQPAEDPLPPGAGLPDSEFARGENAESPARPAPEEAAPEDTPQTAQTARLVVIDPGHQARPDTGTEPLGPGSSEMKMKVSGGTSGVVSGVPEHELDLTVSLLLRDELESRGYRVLLTRESNDVDLSNRERAEIANEAGADVFLRIHADGSEDPAVNGATTLCPTAASPYPVAGLYARCRLLADCVLDELTAAAGAKKLRVWETDTMSGLNWSQVPVTLVEMGYMTNPDEDAKLNDPAYQALLVQGIANGVDKYFAQASE